MTFNIARFKKQSHGLFVIATLLCLIWSGHCQYIQHIPLAIKITNLLKQLKRSFSLTPGKTGIALNEIEVTHLPQGARFSGCIIQGLINVDRTLTIIKRLFETIYPAGDIAQGT